MIFECNHYTEIQKVKLAAIEFTDYVAIWWDQFCTSRRRNNERPVRIWDELKMLMRKRFVPSYYHRNFHNKLQTLTQGSLSVEDYFKEMKMDMMKADVREDLEATMAQFLRGLRIEIADIVELHQYLDLNELLDKAIKVERQIKRRGSARANSTFQASN